MDWLVRRYGQAIDVPDLDLRQPDCQKDRTMNQIIYIVGAIVIVLALLSLVGLR